MNRVQYMMRRWGVEVHVKSYLSPTRACMAAAIILRSAAFTSISHFVLSFLKIKRFRSPLASFWSDCFAARLPPGPCFGVSPSSTPRSTATLSYIHAESFAMDQNLSVLWPHRPKSEKKEI